MAKNDDKPKKMKRKAYEAELAKLEVELVKLQGWIKEKGLKIAVIFEGRDSAGKGGVIKRITRRRRKRRSGIFSATSLTCLQQGRWCSSTAAGTTVPGWRR
jgi:polyphosphate kinase 2 (PPK2 family)